MKKILFLGGTSAMCDAVVYAGKKGYYTIVLDYFPHSPAKKLADKAYDVSTLDMDGVLQIAREHEIDAVFTGYADVNLLPARIVADEFGLPFYATKHQIDITSDKLLFKQCCREHGIPVVPEYHLDSSLKPEDLAGISYPVIIKPADSYSSKGVSVCFSEQELCSSVPDALSFSKCKEVIVEQYMAGCPDVGMYFNIQNGELSLAAMCERDMNLVQEGKAMQPNALFFPCRFIPLYYEQLHEKLSGMLHDLGMRDGVMFMQAFVVDGKLTPFEMGYRLCGAQEYILCSAENGIDSLDMMIDYAFTGRFEGWNAAECNKPVFDHTDVILLALLKSGRIAKIEGLDALKAMPELLNITQFYSEGDEVSSKSVGTLNQTFARIFLQGDDPKHLLELIDCVQKTLHIYDENGEDMLLPGYDCAQANVLRSM